MPNLLNILLNLNIGLMSPRNLNKFYICCMFYYFWYVRVTLNLNWAPEKIRPLRIFFFFFCYWNLNVIAAQSFSKLSLLEDYNAQHKFDMICLSETFLVSRKHSIPTNDENLDMKGYKLIRADNPSDSKKVLYASLQRILSCSFSRS